MGKAEVGAKSRYLVFLSQPRGLSLRRGGGYSTSHRNWNYNPYLIITPNYVGEPQKEEIPPCYVMRGDKTIYVTSAYMI